MNTMKTVSIPQLLLKQLASAMSALALTTAVTFADSHIWTGGGTTGYWGDTHNWDNGNRPSAGEPPPVVLRFPSIAAQTFNTNDISGLAIDEMRIERAGYVLDLGNATLAGSIVMSSPFPGQSRLYGDPALTGNVQFDIDVDLTLVAFAQLGGNGGLTKLGNGTLQLSGKNSFKDLARASAGCVEVTHDAGLGETNAGTVQDIGACLRLVNVFIEDESLVLAATLDVVGTNHWTGPVQIVRDSLVLTATTGDELTFSGVVSESRALVKRGAGRLIFAGEESNTYDGELRVAEGALLLAKHPPMSQPLDAFAGPVFVGTSPAGGLTAVLRNVEDDQIPDKNVVTVHATGRWEIDGHKETIGGVFYSGGGGVSTGPGVLTLEGDIMAIGDGGPMISTGLLLGELSLGGGTRSLIVSNDANLDVYATVTDGSAIGGIVKLGTGVVLLRSANSYSGVTTVSEGILGAVHDGALGATSAGTVVASGASLALSSLVTVTGEALELNGLGYTGTGALYGNGQCTWAGPITLATTARVVSEVGGELHLRAPIGGPAGFDKDGGGRVFLEGNDANTFAGPVTVSLGQLLLTKTNAMAVPGPLIVGGGAMLAEAVIVEPEQISNLAPVSINVPGRLRVAGVSEAIGSLAGDGELACPQGTLRVGINNATTHFAGPISGDGVLNLVKVGTGGLLLSGTATQTGGTVIENGTLYIDGTFTGGLVTVANGGTLGGNGNLFAVSVNGGAVAPGSSPGTLHIQSIPFTAGSRLVAELNGTLPGSYDQLDVSGGCNLANATLVLVPGFTPALGDSFTLITRPPAAPPVSGTFAGLPEGAKFVVGTNAFEITYLGGDGNDVVLRSIAAPQPAIFTDIIPLGGVMKLRAEATAGFNYTLEATTNLAPPVVWLPIGTVLANPNGVLAINDPDPPNYAQRFYRFVLP